MQKKRLSIVQRISFILLLTLVFCFGSGCVVIWRVESCNMDYIYQLTMELLEDSVRDVDALAVDLDGVLYGLVTSDEVQRSGGVLLSYEDGETSAYLKSSAMDTLIEQIGVGARSSQAVVCAEYIEGNGNVRTVAVTKYYRLSEEAASLIGEQAAAAAGRSVYLCGGEILGEENILIVARELREREKLSLRHIGVIVLLADMEKLGELLTDACDGAIVLQNQEKGLRYVLNDEENITGEYDILISDRKYSRRTIGQKKWFALHYERPDQFFTEVLLLVPYDELFGNTEQIFRLCAVLFFVCSAAAAAVAYLCTRQVTGDIKCFVAYISGLPVQEREILPLYEKPDVRDRDVYALQKAFNSMSARINELVRDNYRKQLLVKETQLSALQAQMNPHFLYNTLNSVYWMAKAAGMAQAAEMISSLSILMRAALSNEETVIPVQQELDIVCYYFVIQKYRYGERLDVRLEVGDECGALKIPKFSVQPLVENAVAYGLECMLEPCVVTVRVFLEGSACVCQVRNTGPAPEDGLMDKLKAGILCARGNGIGLLNIDQRVKAFFGEEWGVAVYRDGEETVAQIRLRAVPADERPQ